MWVICLFAYCLAQLEEVQYSMYTNYTRRYFPRVGLSEQVDACHWACTALSGSHKLYNGTQGYIPIPIAVQI